MQSIPIHDTLQNPSCRETRYEKLYFMLLDAIPSSLLLINPSLRIVLANRHFLEKTHRSEEGTIGHRIEEVFPKVITSEMQLDQRIQQVFEHGGAVWGERMTYHAPGIPLRIYYYSIIPVSWNDQDASVMLLMNDVTEQIRLGEEIRQVERHLASVVESVTDIVVSTDAEGRIITWNAAAERISGVPPHTAKGRCLFEFCSSRHQQQVKEMFERIEKLAHVGHAEWELETPDGQQVPISWACSAMKDSAGKVVGSVAVGRDLTERRKLEAQILQAQKLTALGVMAGGIAHEIRNPLTISSSAAQFLLDEAVPPEFRRECAARIVKGIDRASTIIENLLRFARPAQTEGMIPVDLARCIKETIALVANEARLQKVEFVVHHPAVPLLIMGNASMLQQMVMNMLLNAFAAMPEGGRVTVSLDRKNAHAILCVSDSGCGIPQAGLSRIFDPFYTTRPVGEGTGLGLSLCYSIVKQHFGTIEAESAYGEGTSFTVQFPLHEP